MPYQVLFSSQLFSPQDTLVLLLENPLSPRAQKFRYDVFSWNFLELTLLFLFYLLLIWGSEHWYYSWLETFHHSLSGPYESYRTFAVSFCTFNAKFFSFQLWAFWRIKNQEFLSRTLYTHFCIFHWLNPNFANFLPILIFLIGEHFEGRQFISSADILSPPIWTFAYHLSFYIFLLFFFRLHQEQILGNVFLHQFCWFPDPSCLL